MTIALVDCESFYASCETVFRPDLKGKPVVVLSNNDGCVIARSIEAKQLGVAMGIPWFKIREDYLKKGGIVFSSNYAFYGDMSSRVMSILRSLCPKMECYSIDEAFLDMTDLASHYDLYEFGCYIRSVTKQWVGIPVRIAIGPTKTLAKVAAYQIKRRDLPSKVMIIDSHNRIDMLRSTPIREIWGIGSRLSHHLHGMGIDNAYALANSNIATMRKRFSVVIERMIRELNGEPCIGLEESPSPRKQIIVSRSLRLPITRVEEARMPLSNFVARAAEKLRSEYQHCQRMSIFIRTNRFSNHRQAYIADQQTFPVPTNDSRLMLRKANDMLNKIFRTGYLYSKLGVILDDCTLVSSVQGDLFLAQDTHASKLMQSIDQMNQKGARIFFASQHGTFSYPRNQQQVSQRYTTCWEELPTVS